MPLTEAAVLDALRPVEDPALHRSIVDLEMVRAVEVDAGHVVVRLALAVADWPESDELRVRVVEAVRSLDAQARVEVDHTVMDDEERAALVERLPTASFADPGSSTRVLLIASGKGGVGKSSVTVNLALALAQRGRRVAVVDADVWGFSVPAMLGIRRPPTVVDGLILPPSAHGVAVASIGFFVREDQPVIWRGPMLHKALQQFLSDFYWGEPDFLVVDLPPGTGDIAISLASFLPRAEAYVVTTPQPAAQRVAQRAGLMFQSENIKIPVHGVIENMSWFTGDDGTRYELFGTGGGDALAERLGVPMVGQVPFVSELREGGDVGRPIMAVEPDSEAGTAFAAIAKRIDDELGPTRRRRRGLRIV